MVAAYIKTVAEYPEVRTLSLKLLKDLALIVAHYDEELIGLARTQNEEINGVYAIKLAGPKTKIDARVIVSKGQVTEIARRTLW